MDTAVQKKGHPAGLYLVFFTGMWERFSYYGMRAILILYLTKSWLEGGLGYDQATASMIYGIGTGLTYFTPLIGGWLADNYLGKRKSIIIGGFIMVLAQFVLFLPELMITKTDLLPSDLSQQDLGRICLYLGLFLLIIGNGFFKPNISAMVGSLYETGDKRLDSAFSIFYMGINLGAFLAPLLIGVLSDNIFSVKGEGDAILSYGYRYGFLASAIGVLVGQIMFILLSNKYLGDIGVAPTGGKKVAVSAEEANKPLTKEEKERITAIFIFFFFAIFFFAGFEQAGASISVYTDKFIDRSIGGFEIPTAWFQSVNPLFIVLLAPIFSMFWSSKMGQKLSIPVKMGLGMVILGIGFFFMIGAVFQRGGSIGVDIEDVTIKASIWWLVMTYLIHTIGELCISPVGLSMVAKLSPVKLASILMGFWTMSSFFAGTLAGYISSITDKFGASIVFTAIAIFVIVCGLVMIALNKTLLRMMHGVK